MKYCVFFYDGKMMKYYIYYNKGKYKESHKKPSKCHAFEHSRLTKTSISEKLDKGETMESILNEYCENMLEWCDELKNCKTLILKFDYMDECKKSDGSNFYRTNESNILRFFKKYSSKLYTNETFDKITWVEYLWYKMPYNGGLMKSKPGIYNCLGFDFKMSYPYILASQLIINGERRIFKIPIKEGLLYRLTELPMELMYGLYRIKISSTNEDFNFIFNLKNDTNTYTHFDIEFCRKHRNKFNIKMELIKDKEPNALLYTYNKLINSESIFGYWFSLIKAMREELPKNGLVKLLSSSIWGYLSKTNKRFYNDKELDENPDIKFDYYDNENINYLCLKEKDALDGSMDYMLVDKEQPYKRNYRLKPFITSYQRIVLAEIAIKIGIEKVVRANTDALCFNKDLLTEKDLKTLNTISPTFILESKTTGKFNIKSLNNFEPIN